MVVHRDCNALHHPIWRLPGGWKHPGVTVQTHHQKRVCAVTFFKNETQGEWDKGKWMSFSSWTTQSVGLMSSKCPNTRMCHWQTAREGQLPSSWEGRAAQAPISSGRLEQPLCNPHGKTPGNGKEHFGAEQGAYSLCLMTGCGCPSRAVMTGEKCCLNALQKVFYSSHVIFSYKLLLPLFNKKEEHK